MSKSMMVFLGGTVGILLGYGAGLGVGMASPHLTFGMILGLGMGVWLMGGKT
ncbi:MAG: hypothetical protein II336_17920 [Loktanella sp.]|nr:hypothetical protein [Loktanella sp.]